MTKIAALIAILTALISTTESLVAYPLSLEQRKRLKRYLPRTFPKLEDQEPVTVVAIGDSVMSGYTPLEDAWENNNSLFTYPGIFLSKLAREFFYPGSVHLINPPDGGTEKLTTYLGDELIFENLAHRGATSYHGLKHVTTDAFLQDPDLLLIQYGVNDAIQGVPLDSYKRALQEMIDAGKRQLADMIVFGPSLVNYGGGAMEWGNERPYAMAAKQIADANGVMFIDLGKILVTGGGGVNVENHPHAAMEIVGDRLSRIFNFGPQLRVQEKVHPAAKAQKLMGQLVFDQVLSGPPLSHFTYAGAASYGDGGLVRLIISLRNQTADEKQGTLGALSLPGMIPVEASKRFTIPAGTNVQLDYTFKRPEVGTNADGTPIYYPMPLDDEVTRFSFVLEDTVKSELIDLPVRIAPVSVAWKSKQFINISDQLNVVWSLMNGSDKTVSGNYRVGMGKSISSPTSFTLSPLGSKNFNATFKFAGREEEMQFQENLWIEVEVGGRVTRFDRELEASRDLVLGQQMPMRGWVDYVDAPPAGSGAAVRRPAGGASVRFNADEKNLVIVADIAGIEIPDLGDRAALKATVSIDGRPINEVRSFGFVEPFDVFTRGADGPGYTPSLSLGCFGNGYNMILSPRAISSSLSSPENGIRRLEIRIPKAYLHRHEWDLESADSLLGVKVDLCVADSDSEAAEPFPLKNCFTTNSASFNFEDRTIHGLPENDARGLTTLKLSREPAFTWSVRVY